jgi:hypothetical protein
VTSNATVSIKSLQVATGWTLVATGNTSTVMTIANASTMSGTLTLSAGTLNGAGPLTLNGLFTWNGGTLSIPTSANAGITISPAASGSVILGGALTHTSTTSPAVVTGGAMNFANGSVLTVASGATFEHRSDSSMARTATGTPAPSIVNNGTFRRSNGLLGVSVAIPFTNNGLVEATSTTLDLAAGGTSSGTLRSAGGSLGVGGTFTITGTVEGGTMLLGGTSAVV